MRILHVVTAHTPDNAFGGPMRVAVNLCTGLQSKGHDVEILAMSLGFNEPRPTQIDDVAARLFPGRRVAPVSGFSGLTAPALLHWANHNLSSYDIVHTHLARDLVTMPVARIAERTGVPTVVQTHGMVDASRRLSARVLDAFATRKALKEASAVLYLTEHERVSLADVALLDPARLHRLPNGVPAQELVARSSARPTVLFLGRLHPRKRPDDVVRVAALLRARGIDAQFVIAGPDEGSLASTLDLIESHGLQDSVSYVGGVDHHRALDLMRAADVFLLPSVDEPYPMSVLEALSVGLPVVITTSNGLAGDIRDSGAGQVARPHVAEIAAAVAHLLDPATNAKARTYAREAVSARFDMQRIVDQVESLYRDLTAARSNRR